MFLPEAQQTPSGVTEFTPSSPATTQEDVALMQRVFQAAAANPLMVPPDLMAYILDYIQTSRIIIPIGQVFGFSQQTDIRGHVDSAGLIANGTGFSVTKGPAGEYTVVFDKAQIAVPAIGLTMDNSTGTVFTGSVANATVSQFSVNTFNLAGAKTDKAFYFTASPFV